MCRKLLFSIGALLSAGFSGEYAFAQEVFKPITSTTPIKLVDSGGKLIGPLLGGFLAGSDSNKNAFSIRVTASGFQGYAITLYYDSDTCNSTPYIQAPFELLPAIAGVKGIGQPDSITGNSYPSAKIWYPASPYLVIRALRYNTTDDSTCLAFGPGDVAVGVAKYVTASGFVPPFYPQSQ